VHHGVMHHAHAAHMMKNTEKVLSTMCVHDDGKALFFMKFTENEIKEVVSGNICSN